MKKFKNFMTEKKEESTYEYKYGCAMLYFDFEELNNIHKLIDKDDIYDDEDNGYGLENESHLTLLYGFHYDKIKDDKEIFKVIENFDIKDLILYNISFFENEDYDVLKFDVKQDLKEYKKKDDVLYQINKKLTDTFEYTTDYPDYHPHSTIAYLKPKTAKKYIKELKDNEYKVTPKKLVYSKPNDDGTDKIQKEKKLTNKK
jgi:2'-5' RNA ligase